MRKWKLLLGLALLLGGTMGVGNLANSGWASVAYFCTCYLFIFGLGEILEELIKLNAKLDRIIPNSVKN